MQKRKWRSPRILLRQGKRWIDEQIANGKPVTVTGLALALGGTRKMLDEYKEREEYTEVIETLKGYCENYAETLLFTRANPSGAIFALKQYGWNDKQEIEIGINAKLTTIGLLLKGLERGDETLYLENNENDQEEKGTIKLPIPAEDTIDQS